MEMIISVVGGYLLQLIGTLWSQRKEDKKEERKHVLALAGKRIDEQNAAADRVQVATKAEQFWRLPVRPITTYVAVLSFYLLPFLPAIIGSPVNMEICNMQGGWFFGLFGSEKEVCEYITIGPNITWTYIHSSVTGLIIGFWFGGRVHPKK